MLISHFPRCCLKEPAWLQELPVPQRLSPTRSQGQSSSKPEQQASGGFLHSPEARRRCCSASQQHWLEQAIEALGERITTQNSGERGGLIVFRAMLRYALIAAGAYVIFNVSLAALYGFLAGVCLPIAAVACEVVVEIFITLRRGT